MASRNGNGFHRNESGKIDISNLSKNLAEIDWSFPDSDKTSSLHSIHPYPARFVPELPRKLISTIGVAEGAAVFDPFCGSGVTLVEAQKLGVSSIGVDLNPIACLMSRVKTNHISDDLEEQSQRAVREARKQRGETLVPDIPNLNHWFNERIVTAISNLLWGIQYVSTPETLDALKFLLSSILVKVSNQDSDTRYAAIQKSVTEESVYKAFLEAARKLVMADKNRKYTLEDVEVHCKNILEIDPLDISKPIGLVVTSPPYPNAYEYWLYHKYRMFWLGYDPLEVKRNEIGARAHYFKKNSPTSEDFKAQMQTLFELLQAVVIDSGHVCVVIGRSKIHGNVIDNAELISEVAKKEGFDLLAKLPRSIARTRKSFNLSHANIKNEHILVFKK